MRVVVVVVVTANNSACIHEAVFVHVADMEV